MLVTRYPGASNPAPRQIGDYPTLSLADARKRAREWLDDIERGIDPRVKAEASRRATEAAQREEARRARNTLRIAFDDFKAEHLDSLRTGDQVFAAISNHVLPSLGDRPVTDITRADANDLLKKIARTAPTLSLRVRAYLRKFGRWLEEEERVEHSPFANLKRTAKEKARDRILTDHEIIAVWRASVELGAFGRAFRLMLVTGQRRSEVGEMEWKEVDQGRRVWTIPRERAKADRTHEVPLSELALSILEASPRQGTHVFTTRAPRKSASDATLKATTTPLSGWSKAKSTLDELALVELRRMTGDEQVELPDWHLHDFRRTCASNLARLRVERTVISKILNHAETHVTAIYDRYAYLDEKRAALDRWAEYLVELMVPIYECDLV